MTGLAITAWSAATPHGIGAAALRPGPDEIDLRAAVPGKGMKSFDRLTLLALAAVGDLGELPADTALALGSSGSVRSIMDFSRQSLTAKKPTHVDPSLFPNTVMNHPAGQCAIRFGWRGPNATIGGGRTAVSQALGYGARLVRAGRAPRVVVGGVDETGGGEAWTESCAAFLVTPQGGPALADVLAVEFGVQGDEPAAVVESTVLRALNRAGVGRGDVRTASASTVIEVAVLGRILDTRVVWPRLGVGTGAAFSGFQIAELLDSPGVVVVCTSDTSGGVSCVVLRVHGRTT